MKIKQLAIGFLMLMSGTSNAAVWCTFDKITSVRTGGNNNSICYMSATKGTTNYQNLNICNNSDLDANNRNLSLAMAAMMANKRMQIYAQGISTCDDLTKWFNKIDYLVVLAD